MALSLSAYIPLRHANQLLEHSGSFVLTLCKPGRCLASIADRSLYLDIRHVVGLFVCLYAQLCTYQCRRQYYQSVHFPHRTRAKRKLCCGLIMDTWIYSEDPMDHNHRFILYCLVPASPWPGLWAAASDDLPYVSLEDIPTLRFADVASRRRWWRDWAAICQLAGSDLQLEPKLLLCLLPMAQPGGFTRVHLSLF